MKSIEKVILEELKNIPEREDFYRIEEILKNPNEKEILIAAHRGDWRNSPENSLQSIKNAIKMGIDIVEIDIARTKDNELILLHDETLNRSTTATGKASDFTVSELKKFYLNDGCGNPTFHKIPTLEEALELAKGKIWLNIDKCCDVLELAYDLVEKKEMLGQVIFKTDLKFSTALNKYGELLSKIYYMPKIEPNQIYDDEYLEHMEQKSNPIIYELKFDMPDSTSLKFIEPILKKNKKIWVNTLWPTQCGGCSDELSIFYPDEGWGEVISKGANVIQTDRPLELLEYLKIKKLHR